MAQSTFHFGFGMLCATICTIKPILQAWRPPKKGPPAATNDMQTSAPILSYAMARWCLWSYAAGILAIVPALARRLIGLDPTQPIWNLFLFYPLIDRLPLPSMILGELLMGTILTAQYLAILLAIPQHRRDPS